MNNYITPLESPGKCVNTYSKSKSKSLFYNKPSYNKTTTSSKI